MWIVIINVIGLVLDILGFVLLYNNETPDAGLIKDKSDEGRVILFSESNEKVIQKRKKKQLAFKFIIFGCLFQIAATLFGFCNNSHQDTKVTAKYHSRCHM